MTSTSLIATTTPTSVPPQLVANNPTIREGDKMFTCTTCHRVFNKKANLKVHSRKHTGEKPYACSKPGCGRSFMWKSSVTFHEQNCQASSSSNPFSSSSVSTANSFASRPPPSKRVQKRPKVHSNNPSTHTKRRPARPPHYDPFNNNQLNNKNAKSTPNTNSTTTATTTVASTTNAPATPPTTTSSSITTVNTLNSASPMVHAITSPSQPPSNSQPQPQPQLQPPSQSAVWPIGAPFMLSSAPSSSSTGSPPLLSPPPPPSQSQPLPTSPTLPALEGLSEGQQLPSPTALFGVDKTTHLSGTGGASPLSRTPVIPKHFFPLQPTSHIDDDPQQQTSTNGLLNASCTTSTTTNTPKHTSKQQQVDSLFAITNNNNILTPSSSSITNNNNNNNNNNNINSTINSTTTPTDGGGGQQNKEMASGAKPPVMHTAGSSNKMAKMPKIPISMEDLDESDDEANMKIAGAQESFLRTGNPFGGFAPPPRCSPLPVSSPIVCGISPMPLSPLAPFSPLPADSPAHNAPNPVHPPVNQVLTRTNSNNNSSNNNGSNINNNSSTTTNCASATRQHVNSKITTHAYTWKKK